MKRRITRSTAALTLLMYLTGTANVQAVVQNKIDSIDLKENAAIENINEDELIIAEEDKNIEDTENTNEVISEDKEFIQDDVDSEEQSESIVDYKTEIENIQEKDVYNSEIINKGFDEGLNGWSVSGNEDAVKSSWNNDRSSFVLNYWSGNEYKADTYQTIEDIANGTYEISVFVNSSGYNELYMYADDFGGDKVLKNISSSASFTKVTLEVEVTDNRLTVGFYGDGAAGAWANFDDVDIVEVNDEENEGKIINPEFEYNLDGWESTGTTEIVSWNGGWGNYNKSGCLNYGWYTGKGGYETDTHQTITGLENGTYILQSYAASSGGQEELYMYAKDFDDENPDLLKKADITDAHNFRITFVEVEVTNNQITIGLHAKGKQEEWVNLDSISLSKKKSDTRSSLDVIENNSFKQGLNGWDISGTSGAVSIDTKDGFKDNISLKYHSDKAYEVRAEQVITGLENGHYKFEFYAKSSGGQDRIYGYARNTGSSEARTSVPVDENFRKVVVDFEVTNNEAAIGFYSKASGKCISNFDNAKLYKVNEGYTMLKGGDLTELNYVEDVGGVYYDQNGNARDPFHILAENGFNFARLRIYNKTGRENGHKYEDGTEYYLPDGYQNKEDMLKLAKRAQDVGMEIELTLHYSDWWTNGLTHDIPGEWQDAIKGMDDDEAVEKLEQLVYEYTKDVMVSLEEQGTIPAFISLGNEMQGGILYPYGTVENMETLARFLNAGARAVREVSSSTKIILHLDEAGDNNRYYKLLDGCEDYNVDYDIIGPSYYPFWTRNSVEQIIPWCNDIYAKYGKKIMFMETGYNWNPTMYNSDKVGQLKDNGNESHESTPQGQKEFMDELFNGMRNADDNCILGDLYWDPILINNKNVGWAMLKGEAEDGSQDTVGENVVANTTLFDFEGKALKSLKSYADNTEGTIYGMISGIVVDTKGSIVKDAEVTINVDGTIYKRTTDKYGRYFLNNVNESEVEITIDKEGYNSLSKIVNVEAGQVSELETKLSSKSQGSSSGGSSGGSRHEHSEESVESGAEILQNGWYKNENGSFSYIVDGEKVLNQWIRSNDKWYFINAQGDMECGWINVNGNWYYLDTNGEMKTGWLKDNDKWYYLNHSGEMKTGWLKEGGKWYYLNSSGEMRTGWLKDNDKWYYLTDSGEMHIGWLNEGGKWYYLNSDGSMKSGWHKHNNTWYYLYESGEMAVSSIIDGYIINEKGQWIN